MEYNQIKLQLIKNQTVYNQFESLDIEHIINKLLLLHKS